jgi:orotate phosphoribosyltransferase
MSDLNLLFESGAFKVAPANEPFLYTSGLIGPYFINTHFLCGGENVANEVLSLIDRDCRKPGFQQVLCSQLENIYNSSAIFKSAIDAAANLIIKEIGLASFHYVSGGERRDWFFSPLIARLLDKPLLWIYKDGTTLDSNGVELTDLKEEKAINVADLLTIGSSYERAWSPELKKRNGLLKYSLNIVDRKQGGERILLNLGLEKVLSVYQIDENFFKAALDKNLISTAQFDLLHRYLADPQLSMREFLIANPKFIESAKNSSDQKTKTRIELMIKQNPYSL